MSLFGRFHAEPLFLPDSTPGGNNGQEGNSSLGSPGQGAPSSNGDGNLWPDPADIAPSQPSTRSSTTFAVPFSPRTQRRVKLYGQGVCQKLELPEGSLDEFTKLPDMASMIVYLLGTIKKNERKDERNEADTLIESQEFRAILSERLFTILLSPNLTAYVTGLGSHTMDFIKQNMGMFKVPDIVFEDPELRQKLSSLVRELLTQCRSNIKIKLTKGIVGRVHLGGLAKSIAPESIELTPEHLSRLAFLRTMLCVFTASSLNPGEEIDGNWLAANLDTVGSKLGEVDSKKFWSEVDKELQALRKMEEDGDQGDIATQYFTVMLQQDLKLFPSAAGPTMPKPSRFKGPAWQRVIDQGVETLGT